MVSARNAEKTLLMKSEMEDYHIFMPNCAHCGAPYTAPVYRNTLCDQCGKELKTCRNCRHFSPGAAYDCLEPVGELVADKDRANFCDWFTPSIGGKTAEAQSSDSQEEARKAFNSLFSDD